MSILNPKVGDRVYLTSEAYSTSVVDPTKGSKYECKGTICKIRPLSCLVRWDNGYTNSYIFKQDLTLISSFCDNYKSIW